MELFDFHDEGCYRADDSDEECECGGIYDEAIHLRWIVSLYRDALVGLASLYNGAAGFQKARTEVEPPVTWNLSKGLA